VRSLVAALAAEAAPMGVRRAAAAKPACAGSHEQARLVDS